MKRAAVALSAMLAFAPTVAGAVGGRVATGRDFARLVPPAGAVVEPYANAGYSLRFADGAVEVSVELVPLESRWPFAPPRQPARSAGASDRLAEVARRASSGAPTRYAAVSGVLGWIAENVRYELDRGLSQEPDDVLRRRSGYCTGIARLTVALLGALEIEAREVPGYRFEAAGGAGGGKATHGFHRWVEVYYPDRGWVFSDPVASHQFVPATYLRLSAERLENEPGDGELLEHRDGIEEIDLAPAAPPRVRVRPNDDRRGSAALVVHLAGDGEALLDGEGVRRSARIQGGQARFLGLATGKYELSVSSRGQLTTHKLLTFRAPVLAELTIPTATVPVAGGGMR